MTTDPLPWLTSDCPGVGGVIKQEPEDFVVEEIPAYQPSGSGEHLFLWIEKRDISADYLTRHLARELEVMRSEIGMAGLKDRRAVTRQFVSVPSWCESNLSKVEAEGIRILNTTRHGNKLKTAHLRGNQFSILLREVSPDAETQAAAIAERILKLGFPNYYGDQRFGYAGQTLNTGLKLLREEISQQELPKSQRKFLVRFALSAVQSELFNQMLRARLEEGLIDQVLLGDVMQVTASGGVFVCEDPASDQPRFDAGEIVTTGPLFGRKMRNPGDVLAQKEVEVLKANHLNASHFCKFPRLTPGARRAYLVRPGELKFQSEPEGLRIDVTLPPGVYATMLLREFQKGSTEPEER